MLRAHGLRAGPTQRPLAAGAIAGALAEAAGLPLLVSFGVPAALERAGGWATATIALGYGLAMAASGMLYGALFQRAANDRRGGWLFGLAYGFVLWMLVPVPLLQWLPERPLLVGLPAAGLLLAQLAWGLGLGLAFPHVHRPLQAGIADALPSRLGPQAAAASRSRPRPRRPSSAGNA